MANEIKKKKIDITQKGGGFCLVISFNPKPRLPQSPFLLSLIPETLTPATLRERERERDRRSTSGGKRRQRHGNSGSRVKVAKPKAPKP